MESDRAAVARSAAESRAALPADRRDRAPGRLRPRTGRAGLEQFVRHGHRWAADLAADDPDGSGEALVLLTWCLWHAGRTADAEQVADLLPPGRTRDITFTMFALSQDEPPPAFPAFATTRPDRSTGC